MVLGTSKTMVTLFLLFPTVLIVCFAVTVIDAQAGPTLPADELNALREIAQQLGKRDWDFSLNPCDGNSNWTTPLRTDMLYWNTVNCNCSYPGGVCHVENIVLIRQDLAGVLPPSLAKLPYIKNINLNYNYLNGTIPPEWASTKLEILAVHVNRLSGPIPKYLGNISTLKRMSLGNNMFSGTVPAELGKLLNLEYLILNANNLTGELPSELTNLKNLTLLWLSSNNFKGKIPSFESWTQLKYLEMQASGFEGPIPQSISLLSNLEILRISDVGGGGSIFPELSNMKSMTTLLLRSCNISGRIPAYIAQMTSLKNLDLSFNNLEGEIPNLERLSLETLYLSSNSLTGPVPGWIMSRDQRLAIDLSYNKFLEISEPPACRDKLNLFRSFSGQNNLSRDLGKCVHACPKDRYSVNINCGGAEATIGKTVFEADQDPLGPAKFVPLRDYWGTSSTGDFWNLNGPKYEIYTANNVSVLRMDDSQLYTTARLSPLSLTYYGRCLANGNYTITLHFAEIVFRDNQSFQSLGQRMFDVYIQGERTLKDFNIESEAQGVDKALVLKFKALVTDKNLEIRFRYAGKGTTEVPFIGAYGPLISAISMKSDFKPPSQGISKVATAVLAAASGLFLILTILCITWFTGHLGGKTSIEQDLRGLDLQTGIFTYRQIKAATNNFDAANKIGEGGFGSVYMGTLLDGTLIAVKQLSEKSKQGNREFVNEIGMISALQHPNLVRLYGCCIEKNQLLLVYEYMENNSLAHALFGSEKWQLDMDWPTRQRICVGIAQGLAFLHEESILKIVHRDIKATNVLLDGNLNAKISDFGLARLYEEENTHISTRVAGTVGYIAPEYALWGYLTYKADVYSFGVVTLEIVSGKNITKYRPSEDHVCLLDWAFVLHQKESLMELVDPRLGSNLDKKEAIRMTKVALLCTNPSPSLRPTMSAVVSMLKGHTKVQELNMDPSLYGDEYKFQDNREKFEDLRYQNSSDETKTLVHSSHVTQFDSSTTSGKDLYQISGVHYQNSTNETETLVHSSSTTQFDSSTTSGQDLYQIGGVHYQNPIDETDTLVHSPNATQFDSSTSSGQDLYHISGYSKS